MHMGMRMDIVQKCKCLGIDNRGVDKHTCDHSKYATGAAFLRDRDLHGYSGFANSAQRRAHGRVWGRLRSFHIAIPFLFSDA